MHLRERSFELGSATARLRPRRARNVRLHTVGRVSGIDGPLIGRIANQPSAEGRSDSILFIRKGDEVRDTFGYLALLTNAETLPNDHGIPSATGVCGMDYLVEGDVVSIEPKGSVRVLYRRSSPHNFIFMTEQCNRYCLMCSQPPRPPDDRDRISAHLRLIDLVDPATTELGITGGEPTLSGADCLRLIGLGTV